MHVVDGVEFLVPPDTELEDRCQRRADNRSSAVRGIDTADDFEERALAAAVPPHDPDGFPPSYGQRDSVQHLQALETPRLEDTQHMLAESLPVHCGNPEPLGNRVDFDDGHARITVLGCPGTEPPVDERAHGERDHHRRAQIDMRRRRGKRPLNQNVA